MPTQNKQPERYEPMPGFLDLPGWLWRKMPPVAKVALVLAFVGLIAVALIIAPGIRESKSERAKAEQQERLRARAAREARMRREQRPRFENGPAATSGVPARRRLVDAASASVLADARRRVEAGTMGGPIEGVDCEPFPRNVAGIGAEDSTDAALRPLLMPRGHRQVRADREPPPAACSATPTACGSTSTVGAMRSAGSPAVPPRAS